MKKHWLHGEQMEGFLPCPFTGELPYIHIEEYKDFGEIKVWAWLVSEPWGIEIRAHACCETKWGYTMEECKTRALADVKRNWNKRYDYT